MWRLVVAAANMYDVVLPHFLPPAACPGGCLDWANLPNATEQARIDATWAARPADAANHCAMPARTSGAHEEDGADKAHRVTDSFAGAWCYCANAKEQYCRPPAAAPTQLNLQVASPSVVVASFVTFEPSFPAQPPVAAFGTDPAKLAEVTGVAHNYTSPGTDHQAGSVGEKRRYTLNFVPLRELQPRQRYYYRVRSGAAGAAWSAVRSFRAPYSSGETRIAIYGDAGHSYHNMMGNLLDDCDKGTVDAIVHMGDHAYNLGMADDRRGDAYLNAFEPVLSTCPWVPVIGNHEASDGDHFRFYENLTDGVTMANVTSTATSALGHTLSKATLFGAVAHSARPSGTSRYFSVDVGLVHIAALDLDNLDAAQLAWLDADLAAAERNRGAVPWIVATSHFPLYHVSISERGGVSDAEFYRHDEDAEKYATGGHEFKACQTDRCETVDQYMAGVGKGLEPLLLKHRVDIYAAGHVHDYSMNFPMANGKPCQDHYTNPRCPVHFTEGNGGVPGVNGKYALTNCTARMPWCRTHDKEGGAYGRIVAHNATHLRYEHVQNNGGAVSDAILVVQEDRAQMYIV